MLIDKQKLIIIGLAATLFIVIMQFVIIDNVIVPVIQQDIFDAYQNGYNKGAEESIVELFQQTSNCQQPTSIWIGNNTKQIIDVTCLQLIPSDSTISNDGIGTSP